MFLSTESLIQPTFQWPSVTFLKAVLTGSHCIGAQHTSNRFRTKALCERRDPDGCVEEGRPRDSRDRERHSDNAVFVAGRMSSRPDKGISQAEWDGGSYMSQNTTQAQTCFMYNTERHCLHACKGLGITKQDKNSVQQLRV
ncbi:hypothetical protein Bbelb_168270 [Branchiostoma belcheri]|nr:hypothetical protein Bbelb_168270 [Branchiostoma belcheri]